MQSIPFEHNTNEHMHIIEQYTVHNGCLFSDFRAHDTISTFTWGGAQAIAALFNPRKVAAHNLILVHNQVLTQLIDDIGHTVGQYSPQQGQYIGVVDPDSAALCIAVWKSEGSHSLVAVASSLQWAWRSDNAPPFEVLAIGERWLHNKGVLDCLEDSLIQGYGLPVGVFEALGATAISGDPKVRVEQMVDSWLNSTTFVHKEESLLFAEFETWMARTQKEVLEQHIDLVAATQALDGSVRARPKI